MTVDTPQNWEAVSAGKRAARDALIPKAWLIKDVEERNVQAVAESCGVLTPEELKITDTDATELVKKMVAKELTSEQVVTAFCKRAAVAQQLVGLAVWPRNDPLMLTTDELSDGDSVRGRHRPRQGD